MARAGTATHRTSSAPKSARIVAERSQPSEATAVHTRILRCTLAVEDSVAYWQRAEAFPIAPAERARVAFEQRWFGVKSEARVRTLVADMIERFDVYAEALGLLHNLGSVPARLRPLICHVHTQLADPIYRRFSGDFLPRCRSEGLSGIDRINVADWIESIEPGRWGAKTRLKFGTNLLATAADANLVSGKKDPRGLVLPIISPLNLGYVLYLLRHTRIEGSLENNPYLLSLGLDSAAFRRFGSSIPGVRITDNAGVTEVSWLETNLTEWGRHYLERDE